MLFLEIPEQFKFIIQNASPIVILIGLILMYTYPLFGMLWLIVIFMM